jgi:hypothetical protein
MPASFWHFDAVVFGSRLDVGEGLFTLVVGDILDLVEALLRGSLRFSGKA